MLRPLNDLIVVKRDDAIEQTKGGIWLAPSAVEKMNTGVVYAVGPGKLRADKTRVPVDINIGDHVLFSKYANLECKIDGIEYLTMHESDVVGVLDNCGEVLSDEPDLNTTEIPLC